MFELEIAVTSLLVSSLRRILGVVNGDGTVPSTTCKGIEFKVLLERFPLTWSVIESLFFMMNCHEVKGRDENDGEGERYRGQAQLSSLHTASEWKTEVNSADNMICKPNIYHKISSERSWVILTFHTIWVGIVGLTSRFPWFKSALFLEVILRLLRLRRVQVIHSCDFSRHFLIFF